MKKNTKGLRYDKRAGMQTRIRLSGLAQRTGNEVLQIVIDCVINIRSSTDLFYLHYK